MYKTNSTKIVLMLSAKHTGEVVNTGKMHYCTIQKEVLL